VLNKKRTINWLGVALLLAAMVLVLLLSLKSDEISGRITDETGEPIAGATVRIRTTDYAVISDADGRYRMSGFPPALKVRVTAWADGYYINGRNVWLWNKAADFSLSSYLMADNPDYEWGMPSITGRKFWENLGNWIRLAPAAKIGAERFFFHTAENMKLGCSDCHGDLIYEEWVSGAHALGFSNPLFATMYLGNNLFTFLGLSTSVGMIMEIKRRISIFSEINLSCKTVVSKFFSAKSCKLIPINKNLPSFKF